MERFWAFSATIAGIGAVGLFVLFGLYKKWLSHPALQNKLTKKQIFQLMIIFLCLTFATAAFAIVAYMRGGPAHHDYRTIKPPILTDVSVNGIPFCWTEDGNDIETAGKAEGILLSFAAPHPNDFDITVDYLKVVPEQRVDGKGERTMGFGSGAGFQPTPEVAGEITKDPLTLPLTNASKDRYIIDASGDKAHFTLQLKSQIGGIYTVKLLVGVSALGSESEFEVGNAVFALTDEVTHIDREFMPKSTYRFK